jgi:hypothetical protein
MHGLISSLTLCALMPWRDFLSNTVL